jgi:predicted SAM-dependent methyltransferase
VRILDLGSGPDGTTWTHWPEGEVIDMVKVDIQGGEDVLVMDITSQEFQDWKPEPFDLIVAFHVIEHLSMADQLPVLDKCFRLLKSGGDLHVFVPALESLLPYMNEFPPPWVLLAIYGSQESEPMFHRFGYNAPLLRGYLRAAGFEVLECIYEPFNITFHNEEGLHEKYEAIHIRATGRKP